MGGKYLRYFGISGETPPSIGAWLHMLTDLFEMEIGKCRADGVTSLRLVLTTNPAEHGQIEGPLIDVVIIKHYYDPRTVPESEFEQKRFLLNCLCDCIDAFSARFGWDGGHCRQVAERLADMKFAFERKWKTSVLHPTTKHRAQAYIHFENDIRFFAEVKDKPRAPGRRRLINAFGGMGSIQTRTGYCQLEWADENTIRVWQTNHRDYWDWSLADDSVTFHFPRAERNDPHGLCDLAKLYLGGLYVEPDRARATELLKQSAALGFVRAQQMLDRMERGEL